MIAVTVDMTHATPEEVERFYALQGVGRALDSMILEGRQSGLHLKMQQPANDHSTVDIDRHRPH